ncbi:N-acetyltransferase [Sedimentibacter sp. MB31-C6]|uniref:N-acetyltransferase n=1 Tax=Sedimentibacter sp. MB31-C6 TaxID=3109366 RepID=UPI002DDD8C3D|nr:N-acetyltransferase [Sedimentibacter sp. MB36-C1]WSI03471.1 N-acetyltransferase [Sedimentibacter sp. MB36-C1]
MIRNFINSDLDSVMKLWLKTNIEAHGFIDKNYWHSNYETVKKMLPDATILVYEDKGIILGFVGLMNSYIAGIFIDSDNQSKGIGRLLLECAKERNSELSLSVYKKNDRAVNFYLKEGFVPINEQIDENTNETEINMQWKK